MIGSRFIKAASRTNNNYNLLRLFDVKAYYTNGSHRFLTRQLQQYQQPTNVSNSRISDKFSTFSKRASRSCSTSSSSVSCSPSATSLLGWYLAQLKSRPILTKSITASFVFAASDFTSQMITSPPSVPYNSLRTMRMASYGLLLLGSAQHSWFTVISKIFPERDMLTTLKKLVMGQVIYAPVMTTVFFSYIAALRGETSNEIVTRLNRDLLPTLKNGYCYWPICDFIIFRFIPVPLQPLTHNSCAYLWTIYLSYMANLKIASSE